MDWLHLPPLSALRAFAALDRHGSFSAAARELNVTHAAVAQQVRALEKHLGVALAHRDGRGVALTEDGARLAAGLADGFATLATAVSALEQARADQPLKVSLTHSFARNWLMPRLGDFWAKYPDIPLSLHPDDRLVDMVRDGIDVAIRFGAGHWPGLETTPLMPADLVIVGTKALVGDGLSIAEMQAMRWVVESRWKEQMTFLRAIGIDPDRLDLREMDDGMLADSAMERGYGLTVSLAPLVEGAVAEGRLAIAHRGAAAGFGYHLVTRPGARSVALRSFARWLKSSC